METKLQKKFLMFQEIHYNRHWQLRQVSNIFLPQFNHYIDICYRVQNYLLYSLLVCVYLLQLGRNAFKGFDKLVGVVTLLGVLSNLVSCLFVEFVERGNSWSKYNHYWNLLASLWLFVL